MTELMIEILGYIAVAALLGFLLGWLTWGWGHRDRISAARAEGAREARNSVDESAGLRDQLRASATERARLRAEIDRLTERLAAAEVAAGLRADDAAEAGEDDANKAAASPGPDVPDASAADEQMPAETEEEAAVGKSDMPRPAAETLRQQRIAEGGDDPPVADEQVPPLGGQAGQPEMPRPAHSTLRQQRLSEGAHEPPVIDEQVPPEPEFGAGARPDDAAARPGAAAPASLLADRPAETDDLRRIRGVGKVTERLLNRNGIWLYRQLAGLTPAETAWLAGLLDLPHSRIERERWVEQADSLHRGKYASAEDEPGR